MLNHVRQRWVTVYFTLISVIELAILAIFVWHRLAPNDITSYAEVTIPTAITAAIHIVFMATIYPLTVKKAPPIVNLISSILIGFFLAASLATSNDVWHFRILFIIICGFLPMAGALVPTVVIGVSWSMLIMVVAETLPGLVGRDALIDALATAAALIGWLVFRNWYVKDSGRTEDETHALLEEEQSKSSVLLEYISDGVIILDAKGVIQSLNQSAADIFGWPKEEALHLNYRSLIKLIEPTPTPQSTVKPDAITSTFTTETPVQSVALVETRNKRQRFVDIAASPITKTKQGDESENKTTLSGVIAVLRDVDQQKREEQQRSDFISTASHEMRTPVASIQGFIELALNPKVTVIDEKARGYLDKAHEATKRLGKLFQDLLTVARSEDGRLENNPTLIEVNEFLREIVEPERMQAEQKGLQLIFDDRSQKNDKDSRDIKPLIYVNVDPDRLREVVLNLFENAIKYTSKGMITVGAEVKERTVIIRVSDTGMGIANEDIPHLFQKFYRTDSTATREIGGTGLGLFISKQIIEIMHGRIWAESEVGTGSTFFIELPRVPPEIVQRQKDIQT